MLQCRLFLWPLLLLVTTGAWSETQVRNTSIGLSASSEKVIVTEKTWNNLTDATCTGTGTAYVYLQALQRSALLIVRNFGFTIPPNATIEAIRVAWTVRITDANPGTNRTHPHEVALADSEASGSPPTRWNTHPGDNTAQGWGYAWDTQSYPLAGEDAMWGIGPSNPLTKGAGVSSPLFGVALSVNNLNIATLDAQVTCVSVEVDYVPPPATTTGASLQTTASATTGPSSGPTSSSPTISTSGTSTSLASSTVGTATTSSMAGGSGVPPSYVANDSVVDSNTESIPSWAIVATGLGILACCVIMAMSGSWYMGHRKERALNFMRGVGLPRTTSRAMSDDSESDPGAALDGSSDRDGEEMFVVGGSDVWLDDIAIGREIGQGNFGSVFLATWHEVTDVACKSVSGDDVESTMLEEALQLHRLNHPNIVRFFGLHSDADRNLFIVMEYMPKGALNTFLKTREGRRLSGTALLRICIDTATGMHYLSRKKVVHGDLSARNLLVVSVDDRIGVKIADFGLSLLCDHGVEEAAEGEQYCRIPMSGSRKFPVRHTAPEIVESGRYSSKSDVWSFGVVVWEVYSGGKRPYDGMTNTDVIHYLREGARLARPPACSERVYNIVLRCWHKTPIRRPRFGDIRSDLCEELGGDDDDGDGLQYNTISAVVDPRAENDCQTEQ